MKFAMITGDKANNVFLKLNGERDDCTSFMSWLEIWQGVHYSFDEMNKDSSMLLDYDVVMFSGNPGYFKHMENILLNIKGKVKTIFLPEGDISLYHQYGINSFHPLIYELWDMIDVIFSMEEDKISYYESLTDTPTRFVHVPIDEKMASGEFRTPNYAKTDSILIYGDNNPNCPLTVVGVAKKIKKPLITVCVEEKKVDQIRNHFKVEILRNYNKISQYNFLRLLGRCWLHIYPTRWIGSAREPIACAVARTPCIGSDKSHTQRRLFPKLACDIYDIDRMCELAERLYKDLDFYDEIVNFAWDNVSFYNLENTKKRFMEAINC